MGIASHTHHGIDYIEFTVTDMAASKQFYAAAFGWEFNDYGPEYAGIVVGGSEVGGFSVGATPPTGPAAEPLRPPTGPAAEPLRPPTGPAAEPLRPPTGPAAEPLRPPTGGPLVVLYSSDLDSTLAKVREAGAQIVKQPFEFPGGRRFHFQDPSGNELAVWSES